MYLLESGHVFIESVSVEGVGEVVHRLPGLGLRAYSNSGEGYLPDGGRASSKAYQDGRRVPLLPCLYDKVDTDVERYAE